MSTNPTDQPFPPDEKYTPSIATGGSANVQNGPAVDRTTHYSPVHEAALSAAQEIADIDGICIAACPGDPDMTAKGVKIEQLAAIILRYMAPLMAEIGELQSALSVREDENDGLAGQLADLRAQLAEANDRVAVEQSCLKKELVKLTAAKVHVDDAFALAKELGQSDLDSKPPVVFIREQIALIASIAPTMLDDSGDKKDES